MVAECNRVIRVLQCPGGCPRGVLLILVAMFCSHLSNTTGTYIPRYFKYLMSCIDECEEKKENCYNDCEFDNTCERSRNFCKGLCMNLVVTCYRKCHDESDKLYETDLVR